MSEQNTPFNRAQEVLFKLPLAVLAENEHRKISFANQYFCDLFSMDIDPQLLTGMDCANMAEQSKAYFKEPEAFLSYVQQAISVHQAIHDIELELIDGRHLSATYVPYFKEEVFAGHIWTYQDITAKKEAELSVKEHEAFSAEILDNLPADVAIFDENHKYIYTNEKAIKNPEIRKWIIGKDDFEYCEFRNKDVEGAKLRRAKFLEALNTRKQIEWEDSILNSDGNKDYVLRRFSPLFGKNQELKYMLGYGVNINEIKRHEEELRLSELRYKTVVNGLQEIIFRIDFNGIIEFLNPTWEKITGFTVSHALGKSFAEFTDPADIPKIRQNIFDLGSQKETEVFTVLRLITRSKSSVYMEAYASILDLGDGRTQIWGTLTNVTEKKKAENELLKSIQKERELNELKSRFVNMVSHEIRTPMAGIFSSVELLELISRGDPSQVVSKSQKHFDRIKSQIRRVTELMNDVLLLGKIDAGKLSYHPEKTKILDIINEIIEQEFSDEKRKIEIQVEGTRRPCEVDVSLFKHIITNLISNALKYSIDRPDPVLKLHFNDKNISLEVIDYGIGIPTAEQKSIFSAFNRASNTRNIEGTGLGLVVVKHFVNMHNGKISFKSIENEGTSFKVTLPG